jgi:hypothetical protein
MYGEQECLIRYRLYHSFRRHRHSPDAGPASTHNIVTNISAAIVTATAAVTFINAFTTELLLVTSTQLTSSKGFFYFSNP